MALKQLMINKKIEQRKALLEELKLKEDAFVKRSEELESAIEEAKSDEEVSAVEAEVEKHNADKEENDSNKSELEEEITKLEDELKELNDKEPKRSANTNAQARTIKQPIGGESRMKVNKYETRSEMLERLNQPDVKEFYEKVRDAVSNKRALSDSNLLIPDTVYDRIKLRIGDYSTLYKEVEVIQLNGTARVIIDGDTPKAIWTEQTGAVQELNLGLSAIELDGWKVGGFVPVPNATIEDSMIDLANYIEDRIALAISKAVDDAILNGTGSTGKQLEGIIPAITDVAVTSDFTYADLLPNLANIDNGEDAAGEIIAVMKRQTYYTHFIGQTIQTASDGRQVVSTGQYNPMIPGLRVVFSQYAPDNAVILGDFKKYLIGERKGVQLTSSDEVRFIEDQTVFKGTARYDGKPVDPDAFVLVNYAAEPAV